MAQYQDRTLARALPQLLDSHNCTTDCLEGCEHVQLPSFIVTERGITLTTWAAHPGQPLDIFAMVQNVAALLAVLHNAQRVHRDGVDKTR